MVRFRKKLAENSPKYRQLAEIIKSAIRAGDFEIGVRIPSTSELMDEFGVSAPTVRQAISILENEGYIKKRQGMGTFVFSQSGLEKGRVRKLVGFLVVHIHSAATTMTSSLIHQVDAELAAKGYSLVVAATDGDPTEEEKRLKAMLEEGVCGILWETVSMPAPELVDSLRGFGVPYVFLNTPSIELPGDHVCIDNRGAALQAVETIISSGHNRIAFASLKDTRYHGIIEDRLAGYRDALVKSGIPFDEKLVVWEEYKSKKLGFEILEALLLLKERPTVILATHDMLAVGITAALRERGYSIPEDMALMGFDNSEAGKFLRAPLTTVALPVKEMAKQSVSLLLKRVAGEGKGRFERLVLPADVVVRASCVPLFESVSAAGI